MRECDVPVPPCSSFRLLPSPVAHLLTRSRAWPFAVAVAKATKPPRIVHATAPARWRLESHCPRAIRPLGRYGGAHAIRDSPSDVTGACHRVVRRHTRCSPATHRSMRATQARAAPGVHVGRYIGDRDPANQLLRVPLRPGGPVRRRAGAGGAELARRRRGQDGRARREGRAAAPQARARGGRAAAATAAAQGAPQECGQDATRHAGFARSRRRNAADKRSGFDGAARAPRRQGTRA